MKSNIIFIILFFLISCEENSDNRIAIFNTILINQETHEIKNFNSFLRTHNLSIDFSHTSSRLINDEFIFTIFSIDLKKLYIYNATRDTVKVVNIEENNIPPQSILSIYVHSYDSIFILFENINLKDKVINKKGKTELILFDGQLNIIKKYNLDTIPYFFESGEYCLVEHNILNFQNRIFGRKLLFPMSIYSPGTDEAEFQSFNPNLMCFIDLDSGFVQPLNVKFIKEDIGKKYEDKVSTGIIQYHIINEDSILFTFPHSPSIYIFNVKENKSNLLREFDDFPFQNKEKGMDGDNKVFRFEPLIYSVSNNIYIRKIEVQKYKNKKPTFIIQVLDRNLNQLGFIMTEKNKNFFVSSIGKDIYMIDKQQDAFYTLRLKDFDLISFNDFEEMYLENKKTAEQNENFSVLKLPVEQRYKMYISDLGLAKNRKIVIINVDQMCSSCIDFLMSSLEKNYKMFDDRQIEYLFIGNDINNSVSLISNYNIQTNVNFDLNFIYKKYFLNKEILNYHLIDIENNIITVDSANFEDFYVKTKEFLELP